MATVVSDAEALVSTVLGNITTRLQLTKTQFERATESYEAVTEWLAHPLSPLFRHSPYLYPQGSLALDTTVKPFDQAEFDLDVICLVDYREKCVPEDVFAMVSDRLAAHGTYSCMMKAKDRCIRLSYATESQFHLDVVPAIPDYSRDGTFILIPDGSGDGNGMRFKTSNPKGFKTWFVQQRDELLRKEARARIDPLDEPLSAARKAVLTKCVQLLKRWRDVKWRDEMELATPSIILTFLSAHVYQGRGTLAEAFDEILNGIIRFIETGETKIWNPVNNREVISEKWLINPASFDSFNEGIRELRRDWDDALETARDLPTLTKKLKDLFGDPAVPAVKAAMQSYTSAGINGSLHLDKQTGGLLTSVIAGSVTSAIPVKPHTFFGN